MAPKKKETKAFNPKDINEVLKGRTFKKPEKNPDGTIKTAKYRTGILLLDELLNGGFPHGRVLGLGAEWGVGKTTMLLQAGAHIIETYDKTVYYFDVEGGATYDLFEAMGIAHHLYDEDDNPDGKFRLINVTTIQDIARITKVICQDPDTAMIVIDSDTMVVDQNDMDADDLGTADRAIGKSARMWSTAARPLMAKVKDSEACMIIVHQARLDLSGFMPKVVASGGNATKHMATAEIWGKRKAWIGEGNVTDKVRQSEAIGAYVEFSTNKNRLSKPFKKIMLPVIFGKGVDNLWAYKEWLEETEWANPETGEITPHIKKNGSWYTINIPGIIDDKVQGDASVWELLLNNVDAVSDYVKQNGGFQLKSVEEDTPFDKK